MTLTFSQLIAQKRTEHNALILRSNAATDELAQLRTQSTPDAARIAELMRIQDSTGPDITRTQTELQQLEAAYADDQRIDRAAQETHPGAPGPWDDATRSYNAGSSRTPGSQNQDLRRDELVNRSNGERANLRADESFRDHPAFARMENKGEDFARAQYGSIGQMVRAITTTSGGAIVPTDWASGIIDRARNVSAVLRAGATIVPMDAETVKIGRITGDPTAAFRAQGSTVTASDVTLDNVTLTAKTQSALVVGSMEWFQDAEDADDVVASAIAAALALNLDLTALYGGITAGAGAINLATPPNPRGILAALNANLPGNVFAAATNGTTQTTASLYNELLDTVFKVKGGNETPNAMIYNSRLQQLYAKGYDSTGQPLRVPDEIAALQRVVSNQVPSYTQGTMANVATDVFVGDFSKLLIGIRLADFQLTLKERYADTGQVAIVAHMRADVQLARESAFSVFKALKGA